MKAFRNLAALGAFVVASSSVAMADSITVSGGDKFDNSGMTFVNNTGVVSSTQGASAGGSGMFSSFLYKIATLYSVDFANTSGAEVFSVDNGAGTSLTFSVYGPWTTYDPGSNANGATLDLAGTGTVTETGAVNLTEQGTFSLTSSSPGSGSTDFSYQLIVTPTAATAVTPEPNSLVLLGSGLVGAAGLAMSRRRNGTTLL